MVWLGILILVVAAVAWITSIFTKGETHQETIITASVATLLGLTLFVLGCFTTISSGHVGVATLFGKVQDDTYDEGFHLCNPFLAITEMSVRTQAYTMSATQGEGQVIGDDSIVALSSNGLQMTMDTTVPYRLNPSAAPWVYRNLGPNYVDDIFRPAARTGTRRATAQYTDQECYAEKRSELADKMREEIQKKINELSERYGENVPKDIILVSSVMLRNVKLPDKVKNAIEAKLEADQQQQQMEFEILKEEKEATRKEIEAAGIKKFQDIVSEGITPDLLKWKGIEATLKLSESNNAKVIVIGSSSDGMPIILGGDAKK